MNTKRLSALVIIAILFYGVILSQKMYDTNKIRVPINDFAISPKFIKSLDLGLHSTLASYLWLFQTRTELIRFLFLPQSEMENGYKRYARDLDIINTIDPKYSAPYSLSVIALPPSKYKNGIQAAIEIAKKGIENADPDWQIPFYLAVIYHIDLKDPVNAVKYFDIAGHTPGIPEPTRRFSLNYGIIATIREQTKQIWEAIYETTDDPVMRDRAQAYVIHLTLLDIIDAAVKKYKTQYGVYPKDIETLVAKNFLTEIPKDPLGFEFEISSSGEVRIKQ